MMLEMARPQDPDREHHVSTAVLIRRAVTVAALSGWYLASATVIAGALAIVGRRPAAKRHLARRLVALLEALGPAFIKGGQVLGTRRDILPQVLFDELSALVDSVKPLPVTEARSALASAYGATLDTVFATRDLDPIAGGSVACVYRGRLHDGREVAIKVRRPAIARVMAADLALATGLGQLVARLPLLRGTPVQEVIGHLCDAVGAQLDFAREADNLKRLRRNLSSVPRVWVPELEDDAVREGVVVMEFIRGLDMTVARRSSPAARKRFAAGTLAAMYHMLFIDGFVHCDLHPGNLYFTDHGQVVVLDAGFSVQLSDRMRRLFAEFFFNMALGQGTRCAEIVVESATVKSTANVEGFTCEMARLVERSSGLPARDFSLIAFAAEMFDLQRRFGLHAAAELIFPLLSLLVIEGTVRDLDPDVDFQEAARPILVRGIFGLRPAATA
jgi:ubiquinone biosynthesis protein